MLRNVLKLSVLSFALQGCAIPIHFDDDEKSSQAIPSKPDPMMVSLDASANRIALAYEQLANTRTPATTPKSTDIHSMGSSVLNPARDSAPIPKEASSSNQGGTPVATNAKRYAPLVAEGSHAFAPAAAVEPSYNPAPKPYREPSYAPSEKNITQSDQAMATDKKEDKMSMIIDLPGWSGTAFRAIQIIGFKTGYKVNVKGSRRGAEPSVVLPVTPKTAQDVLRDIGVQIHDAAVIHINKASQTIVLTYKG